MSGGGKRRPEPCATQLSSKAGKKRARVDFVQPSLFVQVSAVAIVRTFVTLEVIAGAISAIVPGDKART
jgi:hypothetical protein